MAETDGVLTRMDEEGDCDLGRKDEGMTGEMEEREGAVEETRRGQGRPMGKEKFWNPGGS